MRKLSLVLVLLMFLGGPLWAKNATAAQYLYMVNKVLPEKKNVSIFLPSELLSKEKPKIERAAATFGIKVKIFLIETARSLGEGFKQLKDDEVLIVYESDVTSVKSSRLFILKKCKERNIPVVTPMAEYSKAGAFLGIIVNDKFKMQDLLVNVQNYAQYAPKFTEEFNVAIGVTQVIK
ncbi:MAG TPA: hypothetical protein ENJ15_05605 [Caldithrix abyssi]|uniref:DUF4154 domain-containing protein n=1 Tax=Caldithrix abyssi TaxID=187145 RepID=A0A7V5RPP4_CALAY|nr:hypothetical protein [Caldithrix abyssi]